MSKTGPARGSDVTPPTANPDAPLTSQEAAEFASALGVRVQAIRSVYHVVDREPTPETYDELVADPIKTFIAANNYDFFVRVKRDLVRDEIRRRGWAVEDIRLLDVGCGSGALMRSLAEDCAEVRGCDPSRSMVVRAGANAVHMVEPTRIPFDDNRFDIVLAACVYHHIPPDIYSAHLADVLRTLRPGGVLMIFEHNPYNPVTRLIVNRCPLDENAILLTARQTRRLLRNAGFANVHSRSYLFLPQSVYNRARGLERLLGLSGLGGQYCCLGEKPA